MFGGTLAVVGAVGGEQVEHARLRERSVRNNQTVRQYGARGGEWGAQSYARWARRHEDRNQREEQPEHLATRGEVSARPPVCFAWIITNELYGTGVRMTLPPVPTGTDSEARMQWAT